MVLREQNAKLRDQIATLVFQQCLSANPPRQSPSDAQLPSSPSLSASQMMQADSGPNAAQSTATLGRAPSANLAQSTLFRAPSGSSQMLAQQAGLSQSRLSQLTTAQQLSQQMSDERKKYSQAVSAKDDRIRELDNQLRALKQAQRAESNTYKSRYLTYFPPIQYSKFCILLICTSLTRECRFSKSGYMLDLLASISDSVTIVHHLFSVCKLAIQFRAFLVQSDVLLCLGVLPFL